MPRLVALCLLLAACQSSNAQIGPEPPVTVLVPHLVAGLSGGSTVARIPVTEDGYQVPVSLTVGDRVVAARAYVRDVSGSTIELVVGRGAVVVGVSTPMTSIQDLAKSTPSAGNGVVQMLSATGPLDVAGASSWYLSVRLVVGASPYAELLALEADVVRR